MTKRMLIDASHPEETRVVVLDGSRLEEFDIEAASRKPLKGNIYLAKVVRVEPSLQAAFVEYGGNRHGFLAFGEIHPDYYQIPVADREKLLRMQAEEAAEEQAEEDRAARRASRDHGSHAGSAADRSTIDATSFGSATGPANPDPPSSDELAGDDAGDAQAAGFAESDDGSEDGDLGAYAPADDNGHGTESGFDRAGEPGLDHGYASAAEAEDEDEDEQPAVADLAAEATGAHDPVGDAADQASADSTSDSDGEDPGPARPGRAQPARMDGDTLSVDAETGEERAPRRDRTDEDGPAPLANTEIETVASEPPQPETIGGESEGEEGSREPRRIPQRWLKNYKIQEVIKRRQVMLVQVVKEERQTKGAALTTYLSLAGRYSVLMPNTPRGGGISRKITSAADRKRLKEVIDELGMPDGMGVIVRTAGAQRPKPEIRRDCEYLLRLWDSIREVTLRSTAPSLIYEEADLIKRSIRDGYSRDIDEVLVEGDEAYRAARDFMRMLMPSHAKKVVPYSDGAMPLFAKHGVEGQLDAMHSPTCQLKSGGYIVINQTEALVAIDVNSGRSTKERHIEETALRTNLEAADEVARQLRLRDLAGLIVIDFIDMESNRNNAQVERRLKEALKNDRARIQLGRISHFGLMEMSRQRLRPSLAETSLVVCPHCNGQGHMRSTESAALTVLRAIEEEGAKQRAAEITVKVAGSVALYLLNHKRARLADIEARHGMAVLFTPDDTLIPPSLKIDRTKPFVPRETPAIAADPPKPLLAAPTPIEFEDDEDEAFDDQDEPAGETDGEVQAAGNGEARAPGGGERRSEMRGEADGEAGRRRRRRRRRGGRREDGTREPGARESGGREPGARESSGREPGVREPGARDPAGFEAGMQIAAGAENGPDLGASDAAEGEAPGESQPALAARTAPDARGAAADRTGPVAGGHDTTGFGQARPAGGNGVQPDLDDEEEGGELAADGLPMDSGSAEDRQKRRRGRRGGRRRRREQDEPQAAEAPVAEAPPPPVPARPFLGATPANPFGGGFDLFDAFDTTPRDEPAPARPEAARPEPARLEPGRVEALRSQPERPTTAQPAPGSEGTLPADAGGAADALTGAGATPPDPDGDAPLEQALSDPAAASDKAPEAVQPSLADATASAGESAVSPDVGAVEDAGAFEPLAAPSADDTDEATKPKARRTTRKKVADEAPAEPAPKRKRTTRAKPAEAEPEPATLDLTPAEAEPAPRKRRGKAAQAATEPSIVADADADDGAGTTAKAKPAASRSAMAKAGTAKAGASKAATLDTAAPSTPAIGATEADTAQAEPSRAATPAADEAARPAHGPTPTDIGSPAAAPAPRKGWWKRS